MKYTYKGALSSVPKLLTASMLSVFLVACGGGTSGDGTTEGALDAVGTTDDFGEVDDGFTDDFGLDSGLTDDGLTDEGGTDDGFVAGGGGIDSDGNGISDANENAICKGFPGTDEVSENADWIDNCEMRADINPGEGVVRSPFYHSTYSTGIQRVLYCSGYGGVSASTAAFADGFFGPATGEAVRAFQTGEGLAIDGIVGPETWSRMQTKVESNAAFIVNEAIDANEYDVFGVIAATDPNAVAIDCSAERNFLGLVGDSFEIEQWRLTDTPGGSGVTHFSVNTP